MTDQELIDLWKGVHRTCRKWAKKARTGTLSPPRFQRPGLWAIGSTYLGALWPLWALPEPMQVVGLENNRRFVHEGLNLLKWVPVGIPPEYASEPFSGEINESVPSILLSEFENYRRSSVSLLPDYHFSEADGEAFEQLERIWTEKAKPVETLVETNRSTDWPSSGVTYVWEIIGENFQDFIPSPGFRTVQLETVERFYPALIRHVWSLPDDGSALVPKCTSTRAKVKTCCLC